MASENPILIETFNAGGTIAQHRFVEVSGADRQVTQANAATDVVVGVARQAAVSGDKLPVAVAGIAKVEAGGTVTRGVRVTADSVGRAVNASTTNASAGIALEAGATGEIIAVLLTPGNYQP